MLSRVVRDTRVRREIDRGRVRETVVRCKFKPSTIPTSSITPTPSLRPPSSAASIDRSRRPLRRRQIDISKLRNRLPLRRSVPATRYKLLRCVPARYSLRRGGVCRTRLRGHSRGTIRRKHLRRLVGVGVRLCRDPDRRRREAGRRSSARRRRGRRRNGRKCSSEGIPIRLDYRPPSPSRDKTPFRTPTTRIAAILSNE